MTEKEPLSPQNSNRHNWIWLLLAIVIVGGVGATIYSFRPKPEKPGSGNAQAGQNDLEKKQSDLKVEESDRWETEEFATAAGEQLHHLGDLLSEPKNLLAKDIATMITDDFMCGDFRPGKLDSAFQDSAIAVQRGTPENEVTSADSQQFVDRLKSMMKPFFESESVYVKFKVIGVDMQEESVETKVVCQIGGRSSSRAVQQTLNWICKWRMQDNGTPLLKEIRTTEIEEVVGNSPTGTLFAECTEAAFAKEPSFAKQLFPGVDYWRAGIQSQYGVGFNGHQGIALGDVNNDGLDDLYVCQPSGLPNRLLLQNLDGTVTDIASQAGVDWLDNSRAALFVDLDNDADEDLVLIVHNMVVFMANDGNGKFAEKKIFRAEGDAGSMSAADYDLDGDLDIFVATYGDRFGASSGVNGPAVYHDANNGGRNMLLRNEGEWEFTDATRETGMDVNNRRWSLACSWADYDDDGDPDLYVANDFGRNNLYRNNGGTFEDVAARAGVEDIAAGMSVSWADVNQDGRIDLYVGNMFSAAGLRIAFQDRFQSKADDETRQAFQRHARGNSLFLNSGDGTFRDASVDAGVTIGRWSWGSKFVDINNDGWQDIVVTNGNITGTETTDL